MVELVTDAIVLGKRVSGERDLLAFLFTQHDGIIPVRVTSGTNITSKLTPYLNTLNIITARIVGTHAYQLAGALEANCKQHLSRESYLLHELLTTAYVIKELLPPFTPEPELWEFMRQAIIGDSAYNTTEIVLKILGYDPQFATCAVCGAPANVFAVSDTTFYCNIHGGTHYKEKEANQKEEARTSASITVRTNTDNSWS